MKVLAAILFVFCCGSLMAQDQWKNIYSQPAWVERDGWQKADTLMALLDIGIESKVADIGCHEGYMTFKLAKRVGRGGMVYAVDISDTKLEKVEKRAEENNLTQVKVVKGAADDPRLPPNALDAVLILDTYHEMDDYAQILQHVKASLKPGGRLLICDPIADSRRSLSRGAQEAKHELAMEYALADLKAAGFTVIFQKDNFIDRTKEKGDKMWVIVVRKD